MPASTDHTPRDPLITATFEVRAREGVDALTVRRIADRAQTTTMAIYSRFGGRQGVLTAATEAAYGELRAALEAADITDASPADSVRQIAWAYREFALQEPGRYEFMFERGLGRVTDFRATTAAFLTDSFAVLIHRLATFGQLAPRYAYCLWSVMHGLISAELTDVLTVGLDAWKVPADTTAAQRMYHAGIEAMITGLGINDTT